MSKKFGLFVLAPLALLLSACTMSASTRPAATPTLESNFPVLATPTLGGMNVVEIAASQTAAAQTVVPSDSTESTPALVIDNTTATPLAGVDQTMTDLTTTDTPLPSPTGEFSSLETNTPLPEQPTAETAKPATYTLQRGEFPYCLARRFNVDPAALMALNGLTAAESESLMPGTTLKIPTSGAFPGPRAWHAHPATYTVQANDTIYGVACYYGDVDPLNIASANGLAAPYTLSVGSQLQIP